MSIDPWEGARVTFEAGALREAEPPVLLEGIVTELGERHVWLRVSAGLMCVARDALRTVEVAL